MSEQSSRFSVGQNCQAILGCYAPHPPMLSSSSPSPSSNDAFRYDSLRQHSRVIRSENERQNIERYQSFRISSEGNAKCESSDKSQSFSKKGSIHDVESLERMLQRLRHGNNNRVRDNEVSCVVEEDSVRPVAPVCATVSPPAKIIPRPRTTLLEQKVAYTVDLHRETEERERLRIRVKAIKQMRRHRCDIVQRNRVAQGRMTPEWNQGRLELNTERREEEFKVHRARMLAIVRRKRRRYFAKRPPSVAGIAKLGYITPHQPPV